MMGTDDLTPQRCLLEHRAFTMFGDVLFRRAESDGTPVMVIRLGDREAALPLRALQREFGIDDETADGCMLGRIAESLDYVAGLRLGDALPAEVLSGKASWEPEARFRRLAAGRLKWQLLAWVDAVGPDGAAAAGTAAPDAVAVARLDSDPALRARVQAAFKRAAAELGQPDTESVVRLVEALAEELGYVEALRERLLGRVQAFCHRLQRVNLGHGGDQARLTTVAQVQRLAAVGERQVAARFAEVDAQTGEVVGALRNIESQRTFIRSNRDTLYRSFRAWEPVLEDWERVEAAAGEAFWGALNRAYQFLAPRFMPVTEWQTATASRSVRGARKIGSAMTW
jgi:hypothetical protein